MSTEEIAPAGGRRSRAEVADALVQSAVALVDESGPQALSVRRVAAAAGVNHGLVHRYFGSKQALVGAVLDHLAGRIASEVAEEGVDFGVEPGSTTHLYGRVLALAILEGLEVGELQNDFPTVTHLSDIGRSTYGLDDRKAATTAAQVTAMGLGWALYEPFLVAASGLDEADLDDLRAELATAGRYLAEAMGRRRSADRGPDS